MLERKKKKEISVEFDRKQCHDAPQSTGKTNGDGGPRIWKSVDFSLIGGVAIYIIFKDSMQVSSD